MSHLSEEQLILVYYGEDPAAGVHVDECSDCRDRLSALDRTLRALDAVQPPELNEQYGSQVWARIEGRLEVPQRAWWQRVFGPAPLGWRPALAGLAFAGLLVGAFLLGRYEQPGRQPVSEIALASDPQAGERVLLLAVGDYLERTHNMLVELSNADPTRAHDVTWAHEKANDLLNESRLYRQTAAHTGDRAVGAVLDELDRVLLEIAHSPAHMTPNDMEQLHDRMEQQGILFKIRVLSSNVERRQL